MLVVLIVSEDVLSCDAPEDGGGCSVWDEVITAVVTVDCAPVVWLEAALCVLALVSFPALDASEVVPPLCRVEVMHCCGRV